MWRCRPHAASCEFLWNKAVTFGSASSEGTVSVKMNDVVKSTADANIDSQKVEISFNTGTDKVDVAWL